MKYNDNGEFKPIYVKASDTLPIGAIVEFDGTEIPDGSYKQKSKKNKCLGIIKT